MTSFAIGDAFWMPLNVPEIIEHLWIIIGKATTGQFICVNMTDFSHNEGDVNCVLNPGEHPAIKKKSVIRYSEARLFPEAFLLSLEQQKRLKRSVPFSPSLLQRVQAGAQSDETPKIVADELKKYFNA